MNEICLYTVFIGKEIEELANITIPFMEEYCKDNGFDFFAIRDLGDHVGPMWSKHDGLDLLKRYKLVIYVDCDVLIKRKSPNILTGLPKDGWDIAVWDQTSVYKTPKHLEQYKIWVDNYATFTGLDPIEGYPGFPYVNAGVVVYAQSALKYTKKIFPETDKISTEDQNALNYAILSGFFKWTPLERKFNYDSVRLEGEDQRIYTDSAFFVHFWARNETKVARAKKLMSALGY